MADRSTTPPAKTCDQCGAEVRMPMGGRVCVPCPQCGHPAGGCDG